MIEWWQGRTLRERLMLAAMALAMAAFVLWYGIYAPLLDARAKAQARYEAAVAEQAQLHRSLVRIKALRATVRPPQSLTAPEEAIRTTAEAAGLPLARVEPDPEGGLRVAIDAAPATQIFPWLAALQREQGLGATNLVVVKGEDGGLRVDATLVRPGG